MREFDQLTVGRFETERFRDELPCSREIRRLRYIVPLSLRSKRSRPILVTTVISSNDDGQTGVAALTKRHCLGATFSLMIARLHCSINSR